MNNETIKKFNFTVKLRGDNVYDLYMDGHWINSRGNSEGISDAIKRVMDDSLNKDAVNNIV